MKDAFGNDLAVGDKVIYIKKLYSSKGQIYLERGVIQRIKKVGSHLTAYLDDRNYGGVTSQCIYKEGC